MTMMRWMVLAFLCLSMPTSGWAGTPRSSPPIDDVALNNFLTSLADHLNTLECLTADPNGSVLGVHGELKCANYGGAHYICMNTGTGPAKTTSWTCLNIAGPSANIIVQRNDVTIDAAVNTLDFSTNFTVTSSPSGEANIDVTGFITGTGLAVNNCTYVPALWNTATDLTYYGSNSGTAFGPVIVSADCSAHGNNASVFIMGPVVNTGGGATKIANDSAGTVRGNRLNNTAVGGSTSGLASDIQAISGIMRFDTTSNLNGGGDNVILTGGHFGAFAGPNYGNTTASKGQFYGAVGAAELNAGSTKKGQWVIGVEATATATSTVDRIIGIEGAVVAGSSATDTFGGRFTNTAASTNAYGIYVVQPTAGGTLNGAIAIQSSGFINIINGSSTANRTFTLPDVTGTLALTTNTGDLTINKADPTLIYDVVTATDTDFWSGVQDDAGSDDDDFYQIGKGTTPGTTPFLTIRHNGQLDWTGTAPSVGSGATDCGTTPSITGNDVTGTITVGSGVNGGVCTVTFAGTWTNAPHCFVQDRTTANLIRSAGTTTTTVAFTGTLVAADVLDYHCIGHR